MGGFIWNGETGSCLGGTFQLCDRTGLPPDRASREILIDEYDKPLLQNLHDEKDANAIAEYVEAFLRRVKDDG